MKLLEIVINVTVAYYLLTGKFTFSTTGVSFDLDASSTSSILYKLMGFSQHVYSSSTASKTSTNVADLSGIKFLYIKSNQLGNLGGHEPNSTNSNDTNVICSISVNVNSFETIEYGDEDHENVIQFNQFFPEIFDIQLTSYNNVSVDLNGQEWEMVLICNLENYF